MKWGAKPVLGTCPLPHIGPQGWVALISTCGVGWREGDGGSGIGLAHAEQNHGEDVGSSPIISWQQFSGLSEAPWLLQSGNTVFCLTYMLTCLSSNVRENKLKTALSFRNADKDNSIIF